MKSKNAVVFVCILTVICFLFPLSSQAEWPKKTDSDYDSLAGS